jgi:hypothetical protein
MLATGLRCSAGALILGELLQPEKTTDSKTKDQLAKKNLLLCPAE